MKVKVVKASKLGLDCWSPNRHLDECDACDRVMRCKLIEGQRGRVKVQRKRMEASVEEADRHRRLLNEAEQELWNKINEDA